MSTLITHLVVNRLYNHIDRAFNKDTDYDIEIISLSNFGNGTWMAMAKASTLNEVIFQVQNQVDENGADNTTITEFYAGASKTTKHWSLDGQEELFDSVELSPWPFVSEEFRKAVAGLREALVQLKTKRYQAMVRIPYDPWAELEGC